MLIQIFIIGFIIMITTVIVLNIYTRQQSQKYDYIKASIIRGIYTETKEEKRKTIVKAKEYYKKAIANISIPSDRIIVEPHFINNWLNISEYYLWEFQGKLNLFPTENVFQDYSNVDLNGIKLITIKLDETIHFDL